VVRKPGSGHCGKVVTAEEEGYSICAERKEDRLCFFGVRMVSILDGIEESQHRMLDLPS
jgi:hypothetical protein